MDYPRRHFIQGAASAAALSTLPHGAFAQQTYPIKPITVLVPFAAGGSTDVIGRVVGVHIDDSVIRDGKIDIESIRPLARMGYTDYTSVEKVFAMFTPEEERNRSSVGLDGGS